MLSEEAYNNILENLYLLKDKENYDWIMESLKELKNGQTEKHELIEVE